MAKPKITDLTINQVIESASVRAALNRRAKLMLPRAQRVAAQAGALELSARLHVESGVRPGTKAGGFKRPYSRVTADLDDDLKAADAGARLTRRQILRRAAT